MASKHDLIPEHTPGQSESTVSNRTMELVVAALFMAVAAVVMRVGFGGLIDRAGRRRVVLATLALYAVVEVGMSALEPGWLGLFGAGGCLFGPGSRRRGVFGDRRPPRDLGLEPVKFGV